MSILPTVVPGECPLPPRNFPWDFQPLPCQGGWLAAAGCCPEPAKAMPTTAVPAQHVHSPGKLLHCLGSLGSVLAPRAAFLGGFSKDEASGTFSMVGNLAGNTPALHGGWRDPCGGSSTLKIQLLPLVWCSVQLSSAPCAPLDHFPPGLDFQEHNQELIPAWVLAHNNKTWGYNSQERHLESSYPSHLRDTRWD